MTTASKAEVPTFEFTPAEVKGIKSVQDATPFVTAAGEAYKRWTREGESRQVAAALATHVAYATGYVGGSSPIKTQAEYATDLFGVQTPSEVTRWRTMGHAIMVVGFKPDSMDFRRVAQACTRSDVRTAIMAADKGNADIRSGIMTLVSQYRDESNKPVHATRQAQTGTQGQTDTQTPAEVVAEIAANIAPWDAFTAALGALEESYKTLSADEWIKADTMLVASIKGENSRRADALTVATPGSKPGARPASKGRKTTPRNSRTARKTAVAAEDKKTA